MIQKFRVVRFDPETEIVPVREKIGQAVPLSHFHWKGEKPVLLAIEDNLCLLRYPNGATLQDVPVQEILDERGRWKVI